MISNAAHTRRPFDGVRVLDLTHVLAGPFCTYQLAVLGADVIKIEKPGEGDMVRVSGGHRALNDQRMAPFFLTQNSNKRSVAIDIETEGGIEIALRLAAQSDVLVENFRTGALEKLGLGYERVRSVNPRLIYCSMTGYGQTGPKAGHTAYDQVIQAASGLMWLTGTPETAPQKAGGAVIDYACGVNAAFAVASALFQRTHTGEGQHIDFSMLDATLTFIGNQVTSCAMTGRAAPPNGNDNGLYAGDCCFATSDGQIMLGAHTPDQSRRLWQALGRPDLAAIATWHDLQDRRDEMHAALAAILLTRTASEWEDVFNAIPVPAARVNRLDETLALAQVQGRGVLHRHDRVAGVDGPVTVPVAAFQMAHGGPRLDSPPPRLGAHTEEVLQDLGYDAEAIAAYRAHGVI